MLLMLLGIFVYVWVLSPILVVSDELDVEGERLLFL